VECSWLSARRSGTHPAYPVRKYWTHKVRALIKIMAEQFDGVSWESVACPGQTGDSVLTFTRPRLRFFSVSGNVAAWGSAEGVNDCPIANSPKESAVSM
jgi:hypothetical protein